MKLLIPLVFVVVLFVLTACTQNVEEVDYSSYCGSGEVYQCGEYVRVFGDDNLVYKDGEQVPCDSESPSAECLSGVHETCSLVYDCSSVEPEFNRNLAVCDLVPGDSVPARLDTSAYDCVVVCPEGYDSFGTQIGLTRCIPSMGEDFFEKRSGCLRTTDNCACVKVERATDGTPLSLGYRCVEFKEYEDFLIQTSGLCKKDRVGIESCVIA